jgi:hypothetical protein
MTANSNLAPVMRALSEEDRRFVLAYVEGGNAEAAKVHSGYSTTVQGSDLLRRPHIAAALRWEVARQMATDGASIGFRTLKRLATDLKMPGAVQATAAKALLQGAGLLDAPTDQKESKSINDMTRDELHTYIESKRAEIDQMEAKLAEGARDVTPVATPQPLDPFE